LENIVPSQKSATYSANAPQNESETRIEHESSPISPTDAMGREIFWEDIGRP